MMVPRSPGSASSAHSTARPFLDVVLVGDDRLRVDLRHVLGDAVALVAHDDGEVVRALCPGPPGSAWATRLRPPIVWRTLGSWTSCVCPHWAARTITAVGRRSLTGRSSFLDRGVLGCALTPAHAGAGVRLGHATRGERGCRPGHGRAVTPLTSTSRAMAYAGWHRAPVGCRAQGGADLCQPCDHGGRAGPPKLADPGLALAPTPCRAAMSLDREPPRMSGDAARPRTVTGPGSLGRKSTCVACPDSKSGGPCRQTNRGSSWTWTG